MKFFVCPPDQFDHSDLSLFIVEPDYYVSYQQDIEEWANKCTPGWELQGCVLRFKSDNDRLLFLLRWS